MVDAGDYRQRPFISRAAIIEALTTLLHHAIYERSLSLYNLTVVDEYIAQHTLPPMENTRAYALANILSNLIVQNYQKYRALSELLPISLDSVRSTSLIHLEQDAAVGSTVLLSWAVLYYRYIRTELELSQDHLAKVMNVTDKTVRRYQSRGFSALQEALIHEEQASRQRVRKRYLQAALPSSRSVPLFERERLAQRGLRSLIEAPTLPIIVSGPIGIGKTTLAQEIVRRRIYTEEAEDLRKLIWIHSPVGLEDVIYHVQTQLTAGYSDDPIASTHYPLLDSTILIVIDDADHLTNNDIQHCLQTLSHAALILTMRSFHPQFQATLRLAVEEFDFEHVQLYIDYFSQFEKTEILNEDSLHKIYRAAGGNPLAIQLSLRSHYTNYISRSSNSSFITYYQEAFRVSDTDSQRVWVMLALAPNQCCTLDQLKKLIPEMPATAIFDLADRQIAHFSVHDRLITLYNAARTALFAFSDTALAEVNLLDLVTAWVSHLLHVEPDNSARPSQTQTAFVESTLKAIVDYRVNVSIDLIDQALDLLRRQPAGRTPGIWLTLLEWRYSVALHDASIGVEFARALRKIQHWERTQLELERAVEISGQTGAFDVQAQAMLELAILMRQRGAYSAAQRLLDRAYQIATRYSIERLRIEIRLQHAQLAVDQFDGSLALSHLNDLPTTLEWLTLKGEAALLLDHAEDGLPFIRTAIRRSAGHPQRTAVLQILLGRSYHALGRHRKARQELERAVITLEEHSSSFALGRAWMTLGIVLNALDYHRDARALLQRAETLQSDIRDWVGLEVTRYNLVQFESRKPQ